MTYKLVFADITIKNINKHITGLIAVDKEKAENASRVGAVKNQQLAISIMNTLSAKQSIADLKEKHKSKNSNNPN